MGQPEPEPDPDPPVEEPDPDVETPQPDPPPVEEPDSVTAGIDAPQDVKDEFFDPTLNIGVTGPGQSETAAAAPIGPRTAVPGQQNWVPIGPRNVGGRLRAVVVDPATPATMYVATASGGPFKSTDGGDSWFPLWHDEPSLSMGAMALCAGTPAVVWAATGETKGGPSIPPSGVWRSTDSGRTWTSPVPPGQVIAGARIHALAAHPTDPLTCWAAAARIGAVDPTAGLYRTTDGGATWTQFGAGRGFTDVELVTFTAGLRLFAVPQGTFRFTPTATRAMVVRIDTPDAPDITLAPMLPAAGVFAPGADPLLARGSRTPPLGAGQLAPEFGKLAIFPGTAAIPDPVVYLVLTHEAANPRALTDRCFTEMYRCRNAHTALPTAMTFTALPRAATIGQEGQGGYNIAFAVSPVDPNHLAFGMVDLYLNRAANAGTLAASGRWLRAQQWDLNLIDHGHHGDHHELLFAPAPPAPFNNGVPPGTMVLWDANDGGLSWCANWLTADGYEMVDPENPLEQADAVFPPRSQRADGTVPGGPPLEWRKRSHGISASQMYDLTQHPRLPSVVGCGFQDNGAFIGLSGPSWQHVIAADGGFIAFDPDDPYRSYVTWQGAITESRFPGRQRSAPPLPRDLAQSAIWPRDMSDGFHTCDPPPFVAETVFHPTRPGRVLTTRRNRLYGTRPTTGDRWLVEPLGTAFEILHAPAQRAATFSVLEVLDTPGGRALGLVAQRNVSRREEDRSAESRVRANFPGPYAIGPAMVLSLLISNDAAPAPVPILVPLTVGPTLPASASATQVAAYLAPLLAAAVPAGPSLTRPRLTAEPVVAPMPRELVIASVASGRAEEIILSGTALPALGVARTYFGARAGTGPGAAAAALPAIAPLRVSNAAGGMNLAGRTLQVTRQGGAAPVLITFDAELPPPASSHVTIGQLAAILRTRLPAASYEVWSTNAYRGLRLTSTAPGAGVNLSVLGNLNVASPGVADSDIVLAPGDLAPTRRLMGRSRPGARPFSDTLDLSPLPPATARTLRLREGGNQTALQNLDAAFLGVADLTRVTMVELAHAVREMLRVVAAVQIRCDFELSTVRDPDERLALGEVSELTFGTPTSKLVYAGDSAGRIYRSKDDGETWAYRPSPMDERFGACEAIAIQPDRPEIVLVGLYAGGSFPADAVTMFRSTDGGENFVAAPAQLDNGLVGANRRILGVRALVFDPGAPGHVYAATDRGVFHSPDAGASWAPFNEGLPNVQCIDLALATQTRVLRVGGWGRGVYERRLDPAGVRDVRLHLRTTGLDDGTAQPTPGPDLVADRPQSLRFDASPDIKVLRHDPRIGVVLDGVEFDEEVQGEDVRVGPAFVAVQVHNRGAFPTSTVRVTVLWAIADDGPPPVPKTLWPALANPIAAGTTFDQWNLVGDQVLTGLPNTGHEVVAPGYPRVLVFGRPTPPDTFEWPDPIKDHRRVGVLAIVRSTEDPLGPAPAGPTEVLDLIRTQARIAYRECTVIPAVADDQVLLRTIDGSRMAIVAVPGPENAANGGAPFGLAAVALPGVADVRFTTPGPYALATPARFQVQVQAAATVTFALGDPSLPDLSRVTVSDAANVINRALIAAGVPVRARQQGRTQHVRLEAVSTGLITVAGAAAATMHVVAAVPVASVSTPLVPAANAGPWDFTPGAPQTMTVSVTTTVEIRLAGGAFGMPAAGPFSAAVIRTAINRQLALGGLSTVVVAEPVRRRQSVRRSATEAAGTRHTLGSLALADLVSAPAAVAAGAAREALFDVVATQSLDTVAAAGNNLYLRSANTGNVSETAVRHRLFTVDTAVTPVTLTALGAPVLQPLPAGGSVIVEFAGVAMAGVTAAAHRYVLAVADLDEDGLRLDPTPADLTTLDALVAFCATKPNAALREFIGR